MKRVSVSPSPSIKYALCIGDIVVNIQFLKLAVFRRLVDLDRPVLKFIYFLQSSALPALKSSYVAL